MCQSALYYLAWTTFIVNVFCGFGCESCVLCSVFCVVDYRVHSQCSVFCGLGCESCVLCCVFYVLCSVFCVVEYIHYLAAVGSKSPAGQLHMSLHVHLVLPLHLFTFANFATVLLLANVHPVLPLHLFTFANFATVILLAVVHPMLPRYLAISVLLCYLHICVQLGQKHIVKIYATYWLNYRLNYKCIFRPSTHTFISFTSLRALEELLIAKFWRNCKKVLDIQSLKKSYKTLQKM